MIRALIVEDNPVNYMVMRNQLRKHGLTPVICHNGKEAIEYCTAYPLPDLILLDGYMPEMDGIEFLKWVRARPDGTKPYILFCSSSFDKVDANEALALGADSHQPKPIPQEALAAVLVEVLEKLSATKTSTQS